MSHLKTIQTGKQNLPPRLLIYGTEGIGKSTLASHAPNAIFIQTEDGLWAKVGSNDGRRSFHPSECAQITENILRV